PATARTLAPSPLSSPSGTSCACFAFELGQGGERLSPIAVGAFVGERLLAIAKMSEQVPGELRRSPGKMIFSEPADQLGIGLVGQGVLAGAGRPSGIEIDVREPQATAAGHFELLAIRIRGLAKCTQVELLHLLGQRLVRQALQRADVGEQVGEEGDELREVARLAVGFAELLLEI